MPPEYGQYTGQFTADSSLLELAVYATVFLFILLSLLTLMAVATLPVFFAALGVMEGGLKVAQNTPDPVGKYSKLGGLVFRSLRRPAGAKRTPADIAAGDVEEAAQTGSGAFFGQPTSSPQR